MLGPRRGVDGRMAVMRYSIVVLVLALAILGSGCTSAPTTPQAVATAIGAQASNPTPTIAASQSNAVTTSSTPSPVLAITGSQGQGITVSGALPDALKGFPVPDGFTPVPNGAGSIAASAGSVAVAQWSGTGTVQAISDFYAQALKQQGWSQQLSLNSTNGGTLAFTKGDSQASISIDTSDSKATKVSVTLARNLTTPAAGAAAQATPAPLQITSGGGMSAALTSLPVPNGFTVVPNSTNTLSTGSQGNMATASWTGSSSVADTAAFYKSSMPAAGWTDVSFVSAGPG